MTNNELKQSPLEAARLAERDAREATVAAEEAWHMWEARKAEALTAWAKAWQAWEKTWEERE